MFNNNYLESLFKDFKIKNLRNVILEIFKITFKLMIFLKKIISKFTR